MKGYQISNKLYIFPQEVAEIPTVEGVDTIYVQLESLNEWKQANESLADSIKGYNYNTMTVKPKEWAGHTEDDIEVVLPQNHNFELDQWTPASGDPENYTRFLNSECLEHLAPFTELEAAIQATESIRWSGSNENDELEGTGELNGDGEVWSHVTEVSGVDYGFIGDDRVFYLVDYDWNQDEEHPTPTMLLEYNPDTCNIDIYLSNDYDNYSVYINQYY